MEDPVFIHPSSVLYHANKDYVVYQSVEESGSKIYMKGLCENGFIKRFIA